MHSNSIILIISTSKTFIAGAKLDNNILKTAGGRVLGVVAVEKTLEEARKKAYDNINKVKFEGIYFRKDI